MTTSNEPMAAGLSARSTTDGPWCWQNKSARRRIREAFDKSNNVTTALGVYDALAEIASDEQSEQFTTTHAWIQHISGVGVTTIKKHLAVLVEMGLVQIGAPVLRAPSTYLLIAFTDSQPVTSDSQPVANVSQRAKNELLATSEESKKNLGRIGKKVSPARSRFEPPTQAEWIAFADELKWPPKDAIRAFDHYVACGWVIGKGKPMRDWQAAARNCHSRYQDDNRVVPVPAPPEQDLKFVEA